MVFSVNDSGCILSRHFIELWKFFTSKLYLPHVLYVRSNKPVGACIVNNFAHTPEAETIVSTPVARIYKAFIIFNKSYLTLINNNNNKFRVVHFNLFPWDCFPINPELHGGNPLSITHYFEIFYLNRPLTFNFV